MAARLIDVARLAGVSPSTVSYVLSGNRPISADTRARVEASIEALGFRAHAGARSIRRQRTNVIAFVLPIVPEGQNEVLMQFVIAVLAAARERGTNVLILAAEDGVAEISKVVGSAMVDGLILMEIEENDPRVPVVRSLAHPAVLIGTPTDPQDLMFVDFDSRAAGATAVEHLVGLGHRHIGYLGHPQQVYDREVKFAVAARDGALAAMKANGVVPLWSPMELVGGGAQAAVAHLFDADPELSAVVVYNERMLPIVMDHLRQIGKTIPEEISLIAICPESLASHMVPDLSYVHMPVAELGRLAFNQLAGLIDGDEIAAPTIVKSELRIGSSTVALPH